MIVTLLTDLGTKDASVAACRAQLMAQAPGVRVVDLSHKAPRHDVARAAYLLGSAYDSFPPGTVHIAAVGVLSGKNEHRLLYCFYNNHHFLAPDNGLIPAALSGEGGLQALMCNEYQRVPLFMDWINDAAAICRLIEDGGQLPYPTCVPVAHPGLYSPQKSPVGIACKPLCSDRYENIVLNIRKEKFTEFVMGKSFSIRTFRGGNITEVSNHYNDVERGKPLCRFNSSGYLEIAVNHGSALELFGIDPTDTSALHYHTVRISVQ